MRPQLIWFLFYQYCICWVNSLYSPRVSKNITFAPESFACRLQGSPSKRYPITNSFHSEFNVPPLPTVFNPQSMVYYIYYDLWFDPDGQGEYNQFVPQLMLGYCLCNSTNSGSYQPSWCHFKDWYIGAQYFFTTNNHQTPHAVTGDLIKVKEGDIIYTEFIYDSEHYRWTLNTGIKNTSLISTVIATQPYMGLLKDTSSWNENAYQTTYMATSWELYGMEGKDNFPKYMNYTSTVTSRNGAGNYWTDWNWYASDTCDFQPNHYENTVTNNAQTQQVDVMDLFYS
eukprot:446726_1